MANILEYMDWRGDILLSVSPLNEVDGLIFSQFVYLPLEEIVENDFVHTKTIEEIGKAFFAKYSREEQQQSFILKNSSAVLQKMMKTERFKDLRVTGYCAEYDPVAAKQFGAVTILLEDGTGYVVYRGTDDTITGWEEDFNLCYVMPIASQLEAEKYLKNAMNHISGNFYVGGHSKGGNLAIYAAMNLPMESKERILGIHNYDGPGFLQNVMETSEYQETVGKIRSFMPQESIIGMILYHDEAYTIVNCDDHGFNQHMATMWNVYGNHFMTADSFKNSSLIFSRANKTWVNEISQEEREQFIEIVFKILKSGSDTVSGLTSDLRNTVNTILKSYKGLDRTTKKMVRSVVFQMIRLGARSIGENHKEKKQTEEY